MRWSWLTEDDSRALRESTGMTSTEFSQVIERGTPKGKHINTDPYNQFNKSYDHVGIKFHNTSDLRGVSGVNNRIILNVYGFNKEKDVPSSKVKVELGSRSPQFDKLRAKTGTPEAIAKYILAYLNNQATKEER